MCVSVRIYRPALYKDLQIELDVVCLHRLYGVRYSLLISTYNELLVSVDVKIKEEKYTYCYYSRPSVILPPLYFSILKNVWITES